MRATINIQKNRLEQALRQQFNDNGIVIVDAGLQFQPPFIYRSSEGQVPPYIYIYRASEEQTLLYLRQTEELLSAADFIVCIPNSLSAQASTGYAFVDKYRAAGRTFRVEDFAANVFWSV